MRYAIVLLIPLLSLLAACGGGSEDDLTAGEISDDQLALMVLPQDELGPDYAGFVLDEGESGFQSNEDEIEEAVDEDDEREDIDRFGRVNGYHESYDSDEALIEEEGLFSVGSTVRLYQETDGASGDLSDRVEDARGNLGVADEGATLEDIQDFEVVDLADEAIGLVLLISVEDSGQEFTFYFAGVLFRRGRLLGSAFLFALDDRDVETEVTALARRLDQRILGVLRGEVRTRPTAPPQPIVTDALLEGVTRAVLAAAPGYVGPVDTAQMAFAGSEGEFTSLFVEDLDSTADLEFRNGGLVLVSLAGIKDKDVVADVITNLQGIAGEAVAAQFAAGLEAESGLVVTSTDPLVAASGLGEGGFGFTVNTAEGSVVVLYFGDGPIFVKIVVQDPALDALAIARAVANLTRRTVSSGPEHPEPPLHRLGTALNADS